MKFLRSSSKKKAKDSQKSKESSNKLLTLPVLEGSSSLKPVGSKADDGGSKKKPEAAVSASVSEEAPKFSLAAAATAAAVANASASFQVNSGTGGNGDGGTGLQDLGRDFDSNRSEVMFEDDQSQEGGTSNLLKVRPVAAAAPSAPGAAIPVLPGKVPESSSPAVPSLDPLKPDSAPSTASVFRPPIEVTIDPQGIPPSPLRDNNADFPFLDKSSGGGDLLSSTVDEYRNGNNASPVAPQVGAPLGDIAMRTQLWDAQRLVRVILGKPQASDKPLETGSILQAIRAFAVMKQELILLRQQQESRDGDPPAILESLGSPTATTPGSSANFRGFPTRQTSGGESLGSKDSKPGHKGIVEAARKIKALERELQHATVTIHKLQQQNTESNIMQLQQSKLDAQRQLAKIKVDKDSMENKLKVSKKDCAEKEKKYQNLLRQFGEFQDFKSREVEGELSRKTAQIDELQQKLKEKEESKREEHASKELADDSGLADDHPDEVDQKGDIRALREELAQARLAIKKKDGVIQDLQESQAQLQNRVSRVLDDLQSRNEGQSKDENAPSQRKTEREVDETVLKEVQRNKFSTETTSGGAPTKATSQRLQSLQEEHRALVATIQLLEEEMKLGT